jgi:hypothetical protein
MARQGLLADLVDLAVAVTGVLEVLRELVDLARPAKVITAETDRQAYFRAAAAAARAARAVTPRQGAAGLPVMVALGHLSIV